MHTTHEWVRSEKLQECRVTPLGGIERRCNFVLSVGGRLGSKWMICWRPGVAETYLEPKVVLVGKIEAIAFKPRKLK
jgi:hypothetical protein